MDFSGVNHHKMKHKTALITGGGRGIGFGIACCLTRTCDKLILVDIDEECLKKAELKLLEEYEVEVTSIHCDVSCRESIEACHRQVMKEFGQIDVLVNNAGICPFVDVMEISPETFQKTLDINLLGAFHFTRLVGASMRSAGRKGKIIFIGSGTEERATTNQVDYAASKRALLMMMKGFATSLGPYGITCNSVSPGYITTELTRNIWENPENWEQVKHRFPVGRPGTIYDVGSAVCFLASEDSDYINGTTLRVDGGHSALV